MGLFEGSLSLDNSEAFLRGNTYDKTASCLGEKQGTCKLVNNECSSWYNRVDSFLNISLG